jgi:hypothetical protein
VAAEQFIEKFQGIPLGSRSPLLTQDANEGLRSRGIEQMSRDNDRLDFKAIARISRFICFIVMREMEPEIAGGDMLPLCEPLEQPERHEDFDRVMCQAGLERFIRPEMPSDYPIAEGAKAASQTDEMACVLVVQLAPGIRARRGINIQIVKPGSAKERL